MLVLGQLLVPGHKRARGRTRDRARGGQRAQLLLSDCQLLLGQVELSRQSSCQRSRKLEILNGRSVRDLRYGRCSVFGRPFKQDIGHGYQHPPEEEEQDAVESGEPDPGGAARPSQPGG